ncbi:MAG: hypothetical protein ACJA1Z_002454 [Patiriisocius sp.]|jgi:hypothetical protein
MSTIKRIITTLSREEQQEFVRILRRRNKRRDTKNIKLFQLLSTSEELTSLDILLYGKPAKGAYHALCKRLHDALIDFVATKNFDGESSEEMDALKLVLASRIFFQQKEVAIAFKTLAKAELIAVKHSFFSILNEIYNTQLAHAHLKGTLELEEVIEKYQSNKLNIQNEENLNLFYATIQAELNQRNPQVIDIINRNLVKFNISINTNLSYDSLFKILQITNEIAHITRNYYPILSFVKSAFQKIEITDKTQNKFLNEHLQILYYLSNTNFRIRNFKESQSYLETMHAFMSLNAKKYTAIFYPQYELLRSLILIYTGDIDTSIKNLETFDFKKYKSNVVYSLDLKLTLVLALFFKKRFKDAFQIYRDFYHSDKWYIEKMGYVWVIQKKLIEIVLLIELDYLDLVESRINGFRKKYRAHIIKHNELKILEFLKLISIYFYEKDSIYSNDFKIRVDSLLKVNEDYEDIFALSFQSWIKAKTENTDFYKTCLNYINIPYKISETI